MAFPCGCISPPPFIQNMGSDNTHKRDYCYLRRRTQQPTAPNLDHLLHNHAPTHTPSLVSVALRRCIKYEYHHDYESGDGRALIVDTHECSRKPIVMACFDSRVFADQSTSYQALSRMLTLLNIHEVCHPLIIAKVTSLGCEVEDNELSLFAEIVVVKEFVRAEEIELIDMAIRESMAESERRQHGMVPARKPAIFKALKIERVSGECRRKRRRVEEESTESCTICMEELPVGAYVTRMTCSHRFHGQCIVKWLKTSHSCPVCRFQIPTTT